jgi:predicted nucleic acid-binding protein
MVNDLVDANVLIELLKNYPPAVAWRGGLANNVILGTTVFAKMEVLVGAENKRDQQTAVNFLQQFDNVYLTDADANWAMQQFVAYWLSHRADMNDCQIAAPCYRLQIPLYTRNLKHFRPMLGTLAQKPY